MRLLNVAITALVFLVSSPLACRAADCSAGPGDADGDGLCDAHDPCAYGGRAVLREYEVTLNQLGDGVANDILRFRGTFLISDVLDPAASGLRIVLLDGEWRSADEVVLDVAAPAGAGWVVDGNRRHWQFRADRSTTSGITGADVKEVAPHPGFLVPHQYAVEIEARNGLYKPTSDLESHLAMVAFAGSGATDRCATNAFYPWLFTGIPGAEPFEAYDWMPTCKLKSHGQRLECESGRRVGPCRVSLPDDLVVCDVMNAGAAEAKYHAAHGTYRSGPCDALPGFSGSPGVTCTTSGDATGFIVQTSHTQGFRSCTLTSAAPASPTCVN